MKLPINKMHPTTRRQERKNTISLKSKPTICTCITLLRTFLCRFRTTRTWKCLILKKQRLNFLQFWQSARCRRVVGYFKKSLIIDLTWDFPAFHSWNKHKKLWRNHCSCIPLQDNEIPPRKKEINSVRPILLLWDSCVHQRSGDSRHFQCNTSTSLIFPQKRQCFAI